jgi:cyclopropane fatty-acyl-phospholipid synthase-like methyltransferase
MQFESTMKTGKPVFKKANGTDLWTYFQQHPKLGEQFNCAMTSLISKGARLILEEYDFSQFDTIIDIGGGQGSMLAGILKKHPHIQGALFELPSVLNSARRLMRERGLTRRCRFYAGDAFKSVPSGYDAYIYQHILHDWSDEKCAVLLKRARKAIPDHGKLVILDAVMVPGNDPHPAKWLDLYMMVALGGRERTKEDFSKLFTDAGFKLTKAKPLPVIGIVEAVPV